MASLRHLSPAGRRWLLLLVAVALFARALVPSGWMPVADAAGPHLALCDGTTMAMPAAMTDGTHAGLPMHHHGAPDHPCSFAAAAASIDVPTLAAPLLPPAAPASEPGSEAGRVAIGRGLAAPPPPPTGPPAFA